MRGWLQVEVKTLDMVIGAKGVTVLTINSGVDALSVL
jgi:hypothetical protein